MFENFDWIEAMRTSPVMLIILFCSVLTLGFAIERAVYFWSRRGNPDGLLSAAMAALRSGDNEEAARVCSKEAHPAGPVAADVLRCMEENPEAAEEKLHIALSEQRLQMERNLGF
ncbi:MAG TPA: hypothetical protein VIE39_04110, partial [Thermoanaerobaculia bacterium]